MGQGPRASPFRISSRALYNAFIRVLTAKIVDVVTEGRQRMRNGSKVWKHRPFSRVVRGFRAYRIARAYVRLNHLEAERLVPYQKERLKGIKDPPVRELLWV